ncbi:MAG: Crp/Fnr family transcriptional regulator [Pseudomonadota bacterium]|nr:MAG: Crp/Fnr family transcriptional regulator [Pseudomonadota bacterium]
MLENIPLLSGLSKQDLATIAEHAITKTYDPHSLVIREGELSDSLYLILYGKTKVFVSNSSGAEAILNILGPGEFFGEMALLDDAPRSASVMTLEPTRLSMITKSAFRQCLTDHPDVAFNLIAALNRRVRTLTENVKNLALLDVYGRVARTLINVAIRDGEEFVVDPKLTHQDIASMVGASREMVSRVLKDMASKGYLQTRGRRLILGGSMPASN